MATLNLARLKDVLSYDPDTGSFTWRITKGRAATGARAGSADHINGYRILSVFGRAYPEHRLAWLYVHGTLPSGDLDHINGDRADNRIANLRQATRSQTNMNAKARRSRSGLKGACWNAQAQRWAGRIKLDGKQKHLGSFATAQEAHAAYVEAAHHLFGKFARVS
jgi:hypothetical protein